MEFSDELYLQYRPLLAKKSRQVWLKLPPRTRAWVGLEDLMQAGAIHFQLEIAPKWDPQKGPFLVWAWILLDRFYTNELIRLTARKRDDFKTECLDDCLPACRLGKASEVVQRLQSRDGLRRVYRDASPQLKKSLASWMQGSARPSRGLRFRMVRAEFRTLAAKYGLTKEDFQYAVKRTC